MRKVPTWECLYVHNKLGLLLSVYVDDIKMTGKKQNMDSLWKLLQEENDPEHPTPIIDQVYSGCTQREAKVDPRAVQFNTVLFKKLATRRGAAEKIERNIIYSFEQITAWSYDMQGLAEKCVERYCE